MYLYFMQIVLLFMLTPCAMLPNEQRLENRMLSMLS
jgi:hypothetical protein